MTAQRIVRPVTAFSLDGPGRRRRPREKRGSHLAFIRGLPCLICGARNRVDAAHIRAACPQFGKRHSGTGEKPSDQWTVPLCATHHTEGEDAQHKSNELEWWKGQRIDPFVTAMALFQCSGDEDMAEIIIREARPRAAPVPSPASEAAADCDLNDEIPL